MFNKTKMILKKIKVKQAFILAGIIATITAMCTLPVSATSTLTFNFDMAQVFSWAQTILDAMMPVLYVTLGLALGFIIINALKNAFRI